MIGRRMMGRIDARLQQAIPDRNLLDTSLGGLSLVCIGDPAQCQALFDEQIYDIDPHAKTQTDPMRQAVQLSNRGREIYNEINEVVVLSDIHRLSKHEPEDGKPLTKEEIEYNDRADRFLDVLHRVRDLTLTT